MIDFTGPKNYQKNLKMFLPMSTTQPRLPEVGEKIPVAQKNHGPMTGKPQMCLNCGYQRPKL